MIKRTLYFGNPARLSKKDSQLHFEPADGGAPRTVPIEDIGIVVLDHPQLNLSQSLLSSLLENNAAVVCTDQRHMPAGMFINFQGHSELGERHAWQIEASEPLKKNLWAQTVEFKIRNQSRLLKEYGQSWEELVNIARQVKSGDPDNREGQAASFYWRALFDPELGFKRSRYGDAPNNLLNYGYAVLRAVIARSLVGSGLWPAIGIHHRNKYNAFALADDMMEPYRPFVDRLVCRIMDEEADYSELTPSIKRKLLEVPVLDVEMEGEKSPLMVASQRTSASLARCFEGSSRKLSYPTLD